MRISFLLAGLVFLVGCELDQRKQDALFEEMPSEHTHITFQNEIHYDKNFNIFRYRNFYNGGGVAIGDINNDGLADIFVTSNFDDNKLYLNKGNFEFEDITDKAGIKGKHAWSTGATFADVNGDGLVDIYVCNSGNRTDETTGSKDDRANELYINNGNLTFAEKATEYHLDDRGFGTHAAFFDYDKDGDLDMYLLNNSFIPINSLKDQNLRNQRDALGGHKFFRNDGTTFTDVSEQAGIYGSIIGFGLGITVGDVNNDNWLDIYISNDFYERDYLYINQKNGTFKESIEDQMNHISASSMGADIADMNNDGNLDIFVTDMLPGDDRRLKTTSTFESYEYFQSKIAKDFYYQYMRNMLHLNNGDGTFSEIGCLSGVQATDWSWGALLFDMDNDGNKDIFVANGIVKNLTDQDFVAFLASEETMQQAIQMGGVNYKDLIDKISSNPIPNYAFQNKGNLQFENKAKDWGLGKPSFSNGAAYGDLDNDGDLDLVVNNNNMPLGVYKNKSVELLKTHFLRVKLVGTPKNRVGIGAKVYVYQQGKMQYLQQMPNRGFQSSSDHQMVFGLGNNASIDSVKVVWDDDKMQVLKSVKADQQLVLTHQAATELFKPVLNTVSPVFKDVTTQMTLPYTHHENDFVDYNRDGLLKQKFSTQGPGVAVGDVNGDDLDDMYFGGANGSAKQLFVQQKNGTFKESPQADFGQDVGIEVVAATFFDADKDKDLDLVVVTGSNEFAPEDPALKDLLYLNDGKGNFKKDARFPAIYASGSCVTATDFDQDGDTDLFIGSRLIPSQYGYAPQSYLLVNDGTGGFQNYTKRFMPDVASLGMVTDAVWADVNKDRLEDLVVTQDWGEIVIFKQLPNHTFAKTDIENSSGWWSSLKPADLDADGDIDFIVGNLGTNTRLVASKERPAELYINDFDRNGTLEQIINCYTEDGNAYPMLLKQDLQKQMPSIKSRFVKFADYAGKAINEIFTEAQLQGAVVRKVTNPNSSVLLNDGKGNFTMTALPITAQFSPIYGIETLDYNHDGQLDVLLMGNFYDLLPEFGRYDANFGLLLKGKGKGVFEVLNSRESGLQLRGQIRKALKLKTTNQQEVILLARNNDKAQLIGWKK
ncbi:MAG: VCBS repeat-containing protein [Spirosomataceae bacterium]